MFAKLLGEFAAKFRKYTLPRVSGPGISEPGMCCSCGWSKAGDWDEVQPEMMAHLKLMHKTDEIVEVRFLGKETYK